MPDEIDTSDFQAFQAALANMPRVALKAGRSAVGQALEAIEEVMRPYPPQPDRKRAKSFNTYVRGTGNYPRAAFSEAANVGGGYKVNRKMRSQARLTSEQIDKKWRMSVRASSDSVEGELRNEASYSGYVLGHKPGTQSGDNVPNQVDFHQATGWANIEDSIATAQGKIDAILDQVIDAVIASLAGGA